MPSALPTIPSISSQFPPQPGTASVPDKWGSLETPGHDLDLTADNMAQFDLRPNVMGNRMQSFFQQPNNSFGGGDRSIDELSVGFGSLFVLTNLAQLICYEYNFI